MIKKKIPWTAVAAGLVASLCFFLIARVLGAGSSADPQPSDERAAERKALPLEGAGPRPSKDPRAVAAGNGIVEPAEPETKVAGQVAGRVAAIAVKEGEHVEKGAILVQFESAVERAAVHAAEADVNTSRAELERTAHGLRVEDIDAAQAEAASAKARAELSASIRERTEGLAKTGAVSPCASVVVASLREIDR